MRRGITGSREGVEWMEQNKKERLVDDEILRSTLMHGALGAIDRVIISPPHGN